MRLLFVAAAVMSIVGLSLAFWHASTRTEYAFIAGAVAWGFVLEQAAIAGFGTYHYSDAFPLTVLDVPLTVAFAWAAVLYAGWQTGVYFGLSRERLPFFVALFALHIDLAIDAVAIRVPYWTWGADGVWFGVPLNNFFGWYVVAFLFVGLYLGLERYVDPPEGRAVLAIAGAAVLDVLAIVLWGVFVGWSTPAQVALLGTMILVALGAVLTAEFEFQSVPLPIVLAPFVVHVFFLGVGVAIGAFGREPALLVVALVMLAIGVLLPAIPYALRRRASARRGA